MKVLLIRLCSMCIFFLVLFSNTSQNYLSLVSHCITTQAMLLLEIVGQMTCSSWQVSPEIALLYNDG